MLPLTAAQARDLDQFAMSALGVPGGVLMENAGRNMAHLLLTLGVTGPVVVCCGKGNNGGDGFVIARHLALAEVEVCTLLFADPATLAGDAAVNFDILRRCRLPVEILTDATRLPELLAPADWVVDALFGSGLTGNIRPPFDAIIQTMNATGKRILAVDIPSGLDADRGEPLGCAVRATHTAVTLAPRVGFANEAAKSYVGRVHVIDLGVPPRAFGETIRGDGA